MYTIISYYITVFTKYVIISQYMYKLTHTIFFVRRGFPVAESRVETAYEESE